MILVRLFLSQDTTSYNMSMVLAYILICIVAFIICMIISNTLNVYNNKVGNKVGNKVDNNKADNNISFTIDKVNESQLRVMNETAVAIEDIRGTGDER